MKVYVLKSLVTNEYAHYKENGYGVEFVKEISRATFMEKCVAETCCCLGLVVVEVEIKETGNENNN